MFRSSRSRRRPARYHRRSRIVRIAPLLVTLAAAAGAGLIAAPAAFAPPSPPTLLWSDTWNVGYDSVEFSSVTSAPDGSTYAAGKAYNGAEGYDVVVMKHRADGARAWVKAYASGAHLDEQGLAIATSKAGIVVVTGRARDASGGWDVITVAWSSGGKRLWVKRLTAAEGESTDCGGRDVMVTAAGDVYVTGRLSRTDKAEDLFVARYSKGGKLLWKKFVAGSDAFAGYDSGDALAMDGKGAIYAAGSVTNAMTSRDMALVKYRPDGRRVFAKSWDWPTGLNEWANDIAIRGPFIVLAGAAFDGNDRCGMVARVDSAGRLLWLRVEDWESDSWAEYTDVGIDRYCHAVVVGWKDLMMGAGEDAFVTRYEPAGDLDWSTYFQGDGASEDLGQAVTVTAEGQVYAAGMVHTSTEGYNVFAVKFKPGGSYDWYGWYNVGTADDGALALSLGSKGVCLAGASGDDGLMLMYAKDLP